MLFSMYGIDGNEHVLFVKDLIVNGMKENPDLLRSDAAHFLLVNFDHMVIRPFVGTFPRPVYPYSITPLEFHVQPEELPEILEWSIKEIFSVLTDRGQPASAHTVLLAIDNLWAELGEIFRWS